MKPDLFLDGLLACARFEENSLMQRCIHALKYDFIKALALPLSKILSGPLKLLPENNFILCPIPLHPKRHKWRGFNQSELLCGQLMKLLLDQNGEPLQIPDILKRLTFFKPQMELNREARLLNMEDAFIVPNKIPQTFSNNKIVLVDDISTTLSTLNAAAKALKMAGAQRIYGLVLARAY